MLLYVSRFTQFRPIHVNSSLSGTHGEWTGLDDLANSDSDLELRTEDDSESEESRFDQERADEAEWLDLGEVFRDVVEFQRDVYVGVTLLDIGRRGWCAHSHMRFSRRVMSQYVLRHEILQPLADVWRGNLQRFSDEYRLRIPEDMIRYILSSVSRAARRRRWLYSLTYGGPRFCYTDGWGYRVGARDIYHRLNWDARLRSGREQFSCYVYHPHTSFFLMLTAGSHGEITQTDDLRDIDFRLIGAAQNAEVQMALEAGMDICFHDGPDTQCYHFDGTQYVESTASVFLMEVIRAVANNLSFVYLILTIHFFIEYNFNGYQSFWIIVRALCMDVQGWFQQRWWALVGPPPLPTPHFNALLRVTPRFGHRTTAIPHPYLTDFEIERELENRFGWEVRQQALWDHGLLSYNQAQYIDGYMEFDNVRGGSGRGRGHRQPGSAKRWRAVINSGKGSNSKAKVAASPPDGTNLTHNSTVGAALGDGGGNPVYVFDPDAQFFRVAADPNCQKLHSFADEPDINKEDWFEYDCLGAPFCGYVCIDIAIGTEVDHTVMRREYMRRMVTRADGTRDPLDIGTARYLSLYAAERGVNLKIWHNPRGRMQLVSMMQKSPDFKTVHLYFEQDPLDPNSGHYKLWCRRRSYLKHEEFPEMVAELGYPWWRWLVIVSLAAFQLWWLWHVDLQQGDSFVYQHLGGGQVSTSVHVVMTLSIVIVWVSRVQRAWRENKRIAPTNNDDLRAVHAKREKIESQDRGIFVDSLHEYVFLRQPFVLYTYRKTRMVSLVRFMQGYLEAQDCGIRPVDPTYASETVYSMRGVNTPAHWENVLAETKLLLTEITPFIPRMSQRLEGPFHTYNAPAHEVIVQNRELILNAQLAGTGNCVVKFRYFPHKLKYNVPVAVCPIGPVLTDRGIMGAGFIPVPDPVILLAAFAGRSMAAPPKDNQLVQEFVQFSINFLKPFIRSVELSKPRPLEETFRANMRGKRPEHEVERILEDYKKHKNGVVLKRFRRHSCFPKMENSYKAGCVKPRLIMVMSEEMMVECTQALDLIHAWNQGEFSRFQVKDLTPSEMIAKIVEASDKKHSVTDYSSFEASVDWMVRKIECYVLTQLGRRGGYYDFCRQFRRFAYGGRVLEAEDCKFKIYSRCSGDYWTSFGNGVVNVCLMAFCAKMGGHDLSKFRMLAEGDDGLAPAEYPNVELLTRLGFKFSTSVSGGNPGDCDFLRSRWIGNKRYLSVGRCMSSVWVKRASGLRRTKQLYLLRCIGNSLYHLSPGHPVITAIVNRIMKDTASMQKFKGYRRYLDTWKSLELYDRPAPKHIIVDETMRGPIAAGAIGFPPIPISAQLELERRIESDPVIYVGCLLNGYDDFISYTESRKYTESRCPQANDDFLWLVNVIGTAWRE